jgi:AcrR family transcriptional regulator
VISHAATGEHGTMGGEMATQSRPAPLRADAERNRRRLIDAAAELFDERGMDASIAEIRERAGVGQGTVFRHFATKEHLVAEVMRERMQALIDLALERQDAEDACAALHDFMVAAAAGKSVSQDLYRAICETAALPADEERELRAALVGAVQPLLERAQREGSIRDDVRAEDVLLLETAASQAGAALAGVVPELWRRYLDLMFDGLRTAGAHPLPLPPPTAAQFDQIRIVPGHRAAAAETAAAADPA